MSTVYIILLNISVFNRLASMYIFISVFFIVVSILSFCLKTHPNCRVPVIRNINNVDKDKAKQNLCKLPQILLL